MSVKKEDKLEEDRKRYREKLYKKVWDSLDNEDPKCNIFKLTEKTDFMQHLLCFLEVENEPEFIKIMDKYIREHREQAIKNIQCLDDDEEEIR